MILLTLCGQFFIAIDIQAWLSYIAFKKIKFYQIKKKHITDITTGRAIEVYYE